MRGQNPEDSPRCERRRSAYPKYWFQWQTVALTAKVMLRGKEQVKMGSNIKKAALKSYYAYLFNF
jgi:hypothetical protein